VLKNLSIPCVRGLHQLQFSHLLVDGRSAWCSVGDGYSDMDSVTSRTASERSWNILRVS